jgi:hypothetical protein
MFHYKRYCGGISDIDLCLRGGSSVCAINLTVRLCISVSSHWHRVFSKTSVFLSQYYFTMLCVHMSFVYRIIYRIFLGTKSVFLSNTKYYTHRGMCHLSLTIRL